MQLKTDNEWYTLEPNEIKYTRLIHSKLYSIIQTIDIEVTYNELLTRLTRLSDLNDETIVLFSKIEI